MAYDPYDVESSRRRVELKRPLRRADIVVPEKIKYDLEGLQRLAAAHGIEPQQIDWSKP